MSAVTRGTWAGWLGAGLRDDRAAAALALGLPLAVAVAAVAAPLPAAVAAATLALAAAFWRSPHVVVLALVVLMGNAKMHYYTGALTIFPEYPVIALATLVWGMRALEGGDGRRVDRALTWLFLALLFAGAVSFVHARVVPRVYTKAAVVGIAMLVFLLTQRGCRDARELGRALTWLEGAAAVVAGYAVLQIGGALAGLETGLTWFQEHGNPDFYYGIGPPVIHQLTKIWRANSFFNDSNILGGYLAAVSPVVLACCLHHAAAGRRARARVEVALLLLLALALVFTLSRSGVLAYACGLGTVLVAMRRTVRWSVFAGAAAVVATAAVAASRALGFNPFVLFARLGASMDLADYSNRTHYAAAEFAVRLFLEHPVTGVGLRNFGYYYAERVDPMYPNMIAHNAFLGYFAETGVLGGVAFAALVALVLRRALRAVRDARLRERAPELHAWNAGLLGALVALLVSNLSYDFYLRTFTWVLSGLAVAAAALGAVADPPRGGRTEEVER